MQVLSFRWYAKYGHFLRAEANVNALTYPLPPRTAVLGLLGALLGLAKDSLPEVLGNAYVAITFRHGLPPKFWHRVKLRKDPPTALSYTIKARQKAERSGTAEKASLHLQEWLWRPEFEIHVALPDQPECFAELVARIEQQRWHFSPCMGVSELLAQVRFLQCCEAIPVTQTPVHLSGLGPKPALQRLVVADNLGIQLLRMPYQVDSHRVFQHCDYYLEYQGRTFPVETQQAWYLPQLELNVVLSQHNDG